MFDLSCAPAVTRRSRAVRLRGTGRRREQQIAAFRAAVEAAARRTFGRCRGVRIETHAEGPDRWRVDVCRGELSASVRLRVDRGPDAAPVRLRYELVVETRSLAQWAAARERWVRLAARAGRLAGLAGFLTLCWLVVGVHAPVFVLGGLLMVVVLLVAFLGGAMAGEWIADRVAVARLGAVKRRIARDGVLRADLRRLREMARTVARARRRIEATADPDPFRAEGEAPLRVTGACA